MSLVKNKWISVFEVVLFYGFVHLVIWGGEKVQPSAVIIAVLMMGLCVCSNWIHGDSIEKIGLARNHFWPNLKRTFLISFPFLLPLIFFAWKFHAAGEWNGWFMVLGYPVWAFAQQYTLLSFLFNRLQDAFEDHPILIPWINGFLFSFAHAPNPILMSVTFISGVLYTDIFRRHPHLIPIAMFHGIFGVGLNLSLGFINGAMSVGPAYLSRIGLPRLWF